MTGEDGFVDVLERLFADYEQRHTLAVVQRVVRQARTDLAGQVQPDAGPEMLERLARHRLDNLPATRRTR